MAAPHQHMSWRLPWHFARKIVTLSIVALLLITFAGQQLTASAQNYSFVVDNGEDLALDVARFGYLNQDVLITLNSPPPVPPKGIPSIISLKGVKFWDSVQLAKNDSIQFRNDSTIVPFLSGQLTIRSYSPNQVDMVLDTAFRAGLTPKLNASQVQLDSFTLVNLCEVAVMWDPGVNTYAISNLMFGLFSNHRNYQSQLLATRCASFHMWLQSTCNMAMYARKANIAVHVYLQAAQRTPFPQLQLLYSKFTNSITSLQARIAYLTPTEILFENLNYAAGRHTNLTMKALEDQADPVLQYLRSQNVLQPIHYCNGSLLSPTFVEQEVTPNMGALWVVSNTSGWLTAIPKMLAIAKQSESQWFPPPTVILSGTVDLTNAVLPSQTFEAHALSTIAGAFNDVPAYAIASVINVGYRTAVFTLTANSTLFWQRLTLKGLPITPLRYPTLDRYANQMAPNTTTALSFGFVQQCNSTDWLSQPQIFMHNMTLELPTDDYLAFAELAVRSNGSSIGHCIGADAVMKADQLSNGLLDLRDVEMYPTWMHVRNYTGWGVSLQHLQVIPADTDALQIQALAACMAQGSGTRSAHPVAAIAAGVAVGGILLILLTVTLVLMYRRNTCVGAPLGTKPDAYSVEDPDHTSKGSKLTVILDSGSHGVQPSTGSAAQVTHDWPPGSVIPTAPSTPAVMVSAVESLSQHRKASNSSKRAQTTHMRSADTHFFSDQSMVSATDMLDDSDTGAGTVTTGDTGGVAVGASGPIDRHQLQAAVAQRAIKLDAAQANKVYVTGMLGQGSWGTVFSGVWRGLPVALKTMVFELPLDAVRPDGQILDAIGQHSRAIMEAAIAASVGHRNVVCTYHYDIMPVHATHEGFLGGLQISIPGGGPGPQHDKETFKMFLVQELCSATLTAAMENGALQGKKNAEHLPLLCVLLDIARGLEYLHGKGIIHGDLKPVNVLLKVDKKSPIGLVAKLADFGLSSSLEPGATHISNYRSGAPFYVAPEVVHEYRTSNASDIYSFGVIMWHVMSGQRPYVVEDGHYSPNPAFPSFDTAKPLPKDYATVTHRCLQRDPRARPSATELIMLLSQMLPKQPMRRFF